MIELAAVCGFVFLVGVFLRFIDRRMASSIIKSTVNDVKLINDPVTIMNPSDFQQDKSYAYLLGKILKPKPKHRVRVEAIMCNDPLGLRKMEWNSMQLCFGASLLYAPPNVSIKEYADRVNSYANYMNYRSLYYRSIEND